jgi:transcriptional regulator with XRE-family HTH domain
MANAIFFGDVLDFEIKRQGLSRADLARKAQVSFQTISYYIKKIKTPTLFKAIQIADALGCSVGYMIGDNAMKEAERKRFDVIREYKIQIGNSEEWK